MTSYEEIRIETINILVITDPDMESATLLTEKLIQSKPVYDCVVVIGPFVHKPIESAEENAIAHSEVAAIIAQLENIVCRVIYLSAENDPVKTLTQQLHLTPNSTNIYARKMSLYHNLYISGFTEKAENSNTIDIDSIDHEEDQPTAHQFDAKTTPSIIEEILLSEFSCDKNFDQRTIDKFKQSTHFHPPALPSASSSSAAELEQSFGIFLFNFKYAYSLSYFMFHMTNVIETANVKLCIIPAIGSTIADASRLPRQFGGLTIVIPKSLRIEREYTSIALKVSADRRNIDIENVVASHLD